MTRIAYLTWPAHEISGGIKAAFQHVEILMEAGLDAVVATSDGVRPEWFQTTAPLIRTNELRTGDVLVFPENNDAMLMDYQHQSNPKLVFCQNQFLAHRGLAGRVSYAEYGVTHIMCPSHVTMQFCAARFPGMKLAYTPFYLDHARFRFTQEKQLRIAAVPRKRQMEFGAIRDLFRANNPEFRGLEWLYIDRATEDLVAQSMASSAVFLSLARFEAHGMTKLEAMACGSIVAGYTGLVGGTDSDTSRNGFWAAEDDIEGCAVQLAKAVRVAAERGPAWHEMVEEGRRVAGQYRREETARLLVGFWRGVLPQLT